MKAMMHEKIWPQCDLPTASQCLAESLFLGRKPSPSRRWILASARATGSTGDVREFMLAQHGFAAPILQLDPSEAHPD